MSIVPLPVFETDADPRHRTELTAEEHSRTLEPPTSIVVRFGYMRLIGEYDYEGDHRPVCGARLVARTHRGTELVHMVSTACPNSGCRTAVTREEMHEYIENSGGREFPFQTGGKILRTATIEDLNKQRAIDNDKTSYIIACKQLIAELEMDMNLVEVEPILGGELLTFYYMAEERVDFRELVKQLAGQFKTRIEMRQVGARDEARLVADYERCGQHCCCRSFLKVLRPVSMKSAKIQKATLDPLKISGRCGRLMCCLRYEDKTYRELKARLPKRNSRVGTAEGPGVVVETRTIVQLVLVRLEHDNREIAVPVDELMDPETCPGPGEIEAPPAIPDEEFEPFHSLLDQEAKEPSRPGKDETGKEKDQSRRRRRRRRKRTRAKPDLETPAKTDSERQEAKPSPPRPAEGSTPEARSGKSKRRRRRRKRKHGSSGNPGSTSGGGSTDSSGGGGSSGR
ncbi:MAG: hypothetical protein JSV91_15735 [Phycisphaerales bacterium]|nr:MAG: hypothetical protein JSV91_15735 [Phycisphaerales bacterium]